MKQQIVFTRPVDESLESYVAWIRETVAALGGVPDEPPISAEEWRKGWAAFWGHADQ